MIFGTRTRRWNFNIARDTALRALMDADMPYSQRQLMNNQLEDLQYLIERIARCFASGMEATESSAIYVPSFM